jgi:membrane protease YdiL (CAAX protease family)
MTPLAPVVTPAAHSNLPVLLEISCQVLVLLCFIRVAAYVLRKMRTGRLIPNGNEPLRFTLPGFTGAIFAASVLALILLQAAYYMILVVMGLGAFLLYQQRTAEEQFGLAKLSAKQLVKWSLLICGAVIFIEVPLTRMIDITMTAIHLPHPEQESVEVFRQINEPSLVFAFMLQAVLISPLMEELFFRGFLLTFLKNYTSTWLALVLSAGVFAFVHVNLGAIPQLWLLGIVLGIAYEHTGSLLLPIGIHACFNLVTALSLLLDKGSVS